MARWHLRSKRTITGARLPRHRKKKKTERGTLFSETRISERKIKMERSRGGNKKVRVMHDQFANITDDKGKIKKVKIHSVEKNPANPHFVRRNIITRGAVIKTDIGLARVTSRPSQQGVINAVLVEEKK